MSVAALLCREGIPFAREVSLARISSIRCGGTASLWIQPRCIGELVRTLHLLTEGGITFRTVGAMTNTLAPDGALPYPLLSTARVCECEDLGDAVRLGCGARLTTVAHRFMKEGRDVLSTLSTVPGTVGGAVRGNAGAFGHATEEYVREACVFDPSKRALVTLGPDELSFSYRDSILKHTESILVSVTVHAKACSAALMAAKEAEHKARRHATQPREPSLGSIFLRTEDGVPAARLIDACGLKGMRIGDACVSPMHAGFIVNLGAAAATDVRALIDYVKDCVYERYRVSLTPEICLLPKEI